MPALFTSKCNKCDFQTSTSSGGVMYVRDEKGNKVICPHPLEDDKISEVLNIPRDDAFAWITGKTENISKETKEKIKSRVGMNYQYICTDCFSEVFIDPKKDEMKCSKCGSANLKYVADLANKPCPKCKEGIIEKIRKGIS